MNSVSVQIDRRKTGWEIEVDGKPHFMRKVHNGSANSARLQYQRELAATLSSFFSADHAEKPHFLASRMVELSFDFGVSVTVERAKLPDHNVIT